MSNPIFALGFRQKEDPRDCKYPLEALMGASGQKPVSKVWKVGRTLNQTDRAPQDVNSCVGHAAFQFQVSEPIARSSPLLSPFDIYHQARANDEFPGEADEGTSIRAGLNVLKKHGIIKSYHWASSAEQCLEYLVKYGPLIFGTPWTSGMYQTDSKGFVSPTGRDDGGHAYFAFAGHYKHREITFVNSWGESFGMAGHFKMRLQDVEQLLRKGGVAAAVTE